MANLSSEERRKRYSTIARKEDIEQSEARKDINLNTKADERRSRYASKDYLEKYNAYHAPTRYDGSAVNRYLNAYGLNQQRQADRMQEYRNRYAQQQFMNAHRDAIRNGIDNGNNPLGLKNLENPLDNMRRMEKLKEVYGNTHKLSFNDAQKMEKAYGGADRGQLEKLKEHYETARDRDYSGELEWVNDKLLSTATGEQNERRQAVLNKKIKDTDNRLARLYDIYAKKNIENQINNDDIFNDPTIKNNPLQSEEYQAKKEALENEKKAYQNELDAYEQNIDYRTSNDFEKYKEKGKKDTNNQVEFYRNNSDENIDAFWNNYDNTLSKTDNRTGITYTGTPIYERSDLDFVRAITEEEADNYAYILGKYGEEKAHDYLQSIAKHTDVNGAITNMQKAAEQGKKNPLLATAESIGLGLVTPFETAKNITGFGGQYRTYDDYALAGRQEALRSGVNEAIQNTNLPGSENVLPFLYNTANSTADNLLRYAVGGVAGKAAGSAGAAKGAMRLMMAGQVGDSAMKSALDRGLTDSQAVTTAIISAINEELFETISLERLDAMKAASPKQFRDIAKNVGKQILAEGSEEVFTDIGNAIADDLVNGEKSEIAQNIRNYISQGLSEEEAKKKASVDFALQLVESGLAGGLSGATMGGVETVRQINTLNNQNMYDDIAQSYINAGMSVEDAYDAAENDVRAGLENKYDNEGNVVEQTGLKKSLRNAVKSAAELNENIQNLETQMKAGVEPTTPISDADIRDNKENIRLSKADNEYLNEVGKLLDYDLSTKEGALKFIEAQDKLVEKYPERRQQITKTTSSVATQGQDKATALNDLRNELTNTMPTNETSLESQINASQGNAANRQNIEVPQKAEFKATIDGEEKTIKAVNNGKIIVQDNNGREQAVDIREANLTDGASAAVEQAKRYGARGSRLYLDNLESGNIRNYTLAFNTFYNAGKNGKTFYGNKTLGVDTSLLIEAYAAGVADNSKKSEVGGLIRNEARYKIKESEARVLDTMGKKFGVTIQIDNMLSNDANGLYQDGIIHISTNAENPALVVFSHEFTHRLEETSPEAYKEYENFVIDYLKEQGLYDSRAESLKNLYARAGVKLSEKDIRSEIAANATESFLTDADLIESVVNENKSLAQKIIDTIKSMIDDLKDALSGYRNPKSTEAQAIRNGIGTFEKALELWINAAENQTETDNSQQQFSLKESSDKELENRYDELAKQYEEYKDNEDYEEELGDLEYDLRDIVEEYAKKKGFDTLVYHGTQDFGFTKIDTNMSDDDLSFFATNKLEVANTYSDAISEESYIRKVSDKSSYRGNYEFYANIDNMYKIDGKGANWNEINIEFEEDTRILNEINAFRELLKKAGLKEQNYFYDDSRSLLDDLKFIMLTDRNYDDDNKELTNSLLKKAKEIDEIKNNWNPEEHLDEYDDPIYLDDYINRLEDKSISYNTREIARIVKNRGYDGVIIKNIYDDGGQAFDAAPEGDVYIFFKPQEQLKSADPVTYDDEGNVIPLSERFNKKNDDIRFSLKEDSEGRQLSEQQQEYFKDSKAVDDEGRLKVVYHGSDNYGFTVFDSDYTDDKRSLFFTDDIDTANSYAKNTKNVYKLYLNLKNPLIIDAKGNKWFNIRLNDSENEVIAAVEDYVDILNGYDDAITVGLVAESLGNLEDSLDYLIEDSEGYFDDLPETVEKLKELAKKIDKFDSNWNPEEHLDEYGEETYLDDFIRYNRSKTYTTREISKIAEEKGHDGVIINNVYDNGKYSIEHHRQGFGTVYIALNSNQIKSVDNKKPTDNPDIRFSLKEDSNINRNDVAALTGKDPYMAEAVKDLEDIMRMKGGESFFRANQKELYKIYDEIAEEYNIKDYSKKRFADNVKELFDYIQSVDNPDGVDTTMLAMQIADDMLDKGSIKDNSMDELYPTLQQQLRNYKIKIADQDKADLDGGYNAFRKKYFGTLTLSNDGTEVDSVYEDLASSYPELFPEDITHPGDRLTRIADVADMFRKTVDHIEGATKNESAFIIAQDIINKAVLEQTKNDKSIDNKKRLKAQEKVRKQNTNIKKAKKDIHDDYVKLQNKVKALESINKRLSKNLTKAENELGRQKKEFADWAMGKKQVNKEDKYYKRKYDKLMQEFSKKKVAELQKKYSAERRKNIEKIRKMVNELDRSVRRPDKNHYIPKYLVSSMLDVLRTIDLDSGYRKPDGSETLVYMKLKEMQKQYQEMQNDMDYAIASEYNETIDKAIGRLAEITKGRRLNELLDKDIADIVEIMEIITYQMRTARDLLENEKLSDIKEASQKAREQIKEAGRTFNTDAKLKNLFNRYLNNSLSPVRVMRRLEGYAHDGVLSSLGEELQQGERKTKLIRQTANEMLDELYKDTKAIKALEKFRSEKLTYNIGGKNIVITPDMRAAIYLHSLNEQNMKHVVGNKTKEGSYRGGGIIIPNYQKQMKFNNRDSVKVNAAEKYTGQDAVRLSPSDVNRIIKDMTEYDKRIVELYQQVNEYLTKELNDTTMNLYGFKKATVKNYFPLIVDKSILNLDTDALKFDKTLESFGFLKERVNSAKPIYLEGVMDALERQIDQSSLFSGMAIPSRDFKKVWNYAAMDENDKFDNVNKQAQKAMGSYIDKYVGNLQADLAQARERGDASALLSAFGRGKMATGVLTGNLSVVLKQAASYPTAAGGVLGYRDLLAGLTPKGQRGKTLEKIMNKYTPLYQDRNTAAITGVNINDMNILKRRNPKLYYALTGWIESMDKATVRRLWYASENYVKRNFDYKVGSDDYYEEVAKVWEDTIRKTQPIYDTMNRPEYLRQTNELLKFLMMFKTQALQNVGIMVENYGELKARKRDYDKDKSDFNKKELVLAQRQFKKTVSSQIIQSLIFTGITALVDAFIKHRPQEWADEETGLITPESLRSSIIDAWTSNVIGQLAFGDIIRDLAYYPAKTLITGKEQNRFDLSVPPIEAMNTIINGINKGTNAVANNDIEKAKYYFKQVGETAAQYGFGLPVKNIENLYKGLEGNIRDIAAGKNPLEQSTDKQMYNRIYLAYQSGNPEIAAELSKNVDPDKIKTKMVSKLKEEDTIKEAAEYRYNSELDKYQAIVDAYVSLGFDEDWVTSAISSVMNKEHGTTGSGEYNSNDLQRAIDISAVQGSKVANEIYKEKYATYKADGLKNDEAKKKALSSVRSAITGKYKSQYESGTTSQKVKIRDRLCSLRVAGERLYTYDSMKSWNK